MSNVLPSPPRTATQSSVFATPTRSNMAKDSPQKANDSAEQPDEAASPLQNLVKNLLNLATACGKNYSPVKVVPT